MRFCEIILFLAVVSPLPALSQSSAAPKAIGIPSTSSTSNSTTVNTPSVTTKTECGTPPTVCQPTSGPPYTAPEGDTWNWSPATCSWVLSTHPPPACQPTANPPYTAPEGYSWSWNSSTCQWVLKPIPPTGPHKPCPVQGDPPPDTGDGGIWVWDSSTCSWVEQYGSPIIIDTDGSGFHLTSASNGVNFDFFGTGNPFLTSWTAAGSTNGWLALDRNGNGTIDSAQELFGNITSQPAFPTPNGFLALAVFDTAAYGGNADGRIDKKDSIWLQLLVWIDNNHDGISQSSELSHLDDLGIHSIDLKYKESRYTDQFGNAFRYKGTLNPITPDNVNRVIYDVFLVRLN